MIKQLKTFTDPQKCAKPSLSPAMRQAAADAPLSKNVWARPTWTPPAWNPPRGPSAHVPSRGK